LPDISRRGPGTTPSSIALRRSMSVNG